MYARHTQVHGRSASKQIQKQKKTKSKVSDSLLIDSISFPLSLSRLVVYVIGTSTILATFETTTSHHTLWFSQVRSPVRPNDSVHQALAYSIFPRRLPLALQEHARLVSIKFVLSPSQRYRSQVIKGNFCSWDRKRKKSEIKGMNLRLVRWVARSPFYSVQCNFKNT